MDAQTNWVQRHGFITPYHLGGVAFGTNNGQPVFVAVTGPTINSNILTPHALTSPDAITWTQREMDTPAPAIFNSVAFANNRFVAVGWHSAGAVTAFSDDGGMTWTRHNLGIGAFLNDVAPDGNGGFIAVGAIGSPNLVGPGLVIRSPTGTTDWTLETLSVAVELQGVVATGNKTFAVGTQGFIFESVNGGAFQLQPAVTADLLYDIVFRPTPGPNGVLLTFGTNGRILRSTDLGANWSLINPVPTATIIYDMTFNEDVFIGVGFGGIFVYSEDDGASWVQRGPTFPANNFYAATRGELSPTLARFVTVGTLEGILTVDDTNGPPVGVVDVRASVPMMSFGFAGGTGTINLTNAGTASASASISASVPWISVPVPMVSVPAGGSASASFLVLTNGTASPRLGPITVSANTNFVFTISQAGGPPAAPSIDLNLVGPYVVTGRWSRVTGALGYRVEKSNAGPAWTFVLNLSSAATSYVESNQPPWTDQLYRVFATNTIGSSPPSSVFGGRIPPVAPMLSVQVDGWSQATVTWNDVTGGGAYELERRMGTGAWSLLTPFPRGGGAFADVGLSPDTNVTYRMRARGEAPHTNRLSACTSEVTVLTPPYTGVIHWNAAENVRLPYGQEDLMGVAHGNGRYVAAGNNGDIESSPDGVTWTKEPSGTTQRLGGVAFGGGLFVVTGLEGGLFTSPGDGVWTRRTSGTTNIVGRVAYGNGRFVALTHTNAVLVSTNGIDWTWHVVSAASTNLEPGFITIESGIAFGNGEFVMGLINGAILYSADGVNWTEAVPRSSPYNYRGSFAWNGSLWVAGGAFGRFSTSPDGHVWTWTPDPPLGLPYHFVDLTSANGAFVGTSSGGFVLPSFLFSTDGSNWQQVATPLTNVTVAGVTHGANGFVAVGSGGYAAISTDGTNWTTTRASRPRIVQLNELAACGNTVVAVGSVPAGITNDGVFWYRDPVSLSWSNISWALPPDATLGSVSCVNGEFFATGGDGVDGLIYRSADGLSWTSNRVSGAGFFHHLSLGPGRFIAATPTRMFQSTDGMNWDTNGVTGQFPGSLRRTLHASTGFHVVGPSAAAGLGSSADGLNWRLSAGPGPAYGIAEGRMFGRNRLVTAGAISNAVSSDGERWTRRAGNAVAITHASGVFVAAQAGAVMASLDGVVWENAPAGLLPPASGGYVAVSHANGELWALGANMTMHRFQVSAQPLNPSDPDGVPDSVEDGAPNGGDGNGDLIPDRLQARVASLPSASGPYVTLAGAPGTTLMNVAVVPNPSPGNAPTNAQFPLGFLTFAIRGFTNGGAVTVDLLYPTGIVVNAYYKFGAETGQPTPHWYSFAFDGFTGAEFLTPGHLRLHFIDGLRGDDDLTANGIITDDGGPVLATSNAPRILQFGFLPDGRFRVVIESVPGRGYHLEWSSNLVDFVPLASQPATDAGSMELIDGSAAGQPHRLYRVQSTAR